MGFSFTKVGFRGRSIKIFRKIFMINDLTTINPVSPIAFKQEHNNLIKFVKSTLKEAKTYQDNGRDKMTQGDFGIIPRTRKKSLLKPGAEKLLKLLGFSAKNELIDKRSEEHTSELQS